MNFNFFINLNVNQISLIELINFSCFIFNIGLVGIIWNRRNFLLLLIAIELMFFSIILYFIFFSVFLNNFMGQIFCLFIISVTASETAIGLSLLILAYRLGNEVNYDSIISFYLFT